MAQAPEAPRDNLMHSTGASPLETISVIIPSLFYTTITTILISLLKTKTANVPLQFGIEFSTLVIPLILNVTTLANRAAELLTTSLVVCITLIFLLRILKPTTTKTPQVQDYITNSRSTINIISVIAILAVDFLIFPRRFAKTVNWGYSLMDVGVGLFVFSNGIVDGGQTPLPKSIKGSIPLLILGTARFLVTKQINYHVPISEYGIHWNFFITLAVLKIFVSLIFSSVDIKYIWINASLLMISHEVLLQCGLENFVLTEITRDDFITANREGLVSSLGYVCIYLFSSYFSYFVGLKKGGGRGKMVLKLSVLSLLTLVLSLICQYYFGISRKLANSAYVFWVLFIGIFMTGLYYVFGRILDDVLAKKLRVVVHLPLIFQAINYNGLAFFLIGNLLTGLVNIVCDTLKVDAVLSVIIISIYMLINCTFVCILYKKRIKLKL